MEVGWIAIVPADIALIDGLHVVAQGAVVAVGVPLLIQAGWQLEHFGNLDPGVPLVEQAQRLVIHILVEIALVGEILDHIFLPPTRPVVLSQDDLDLVTIKRDIFVQRLCPFLGVAHLGAPQGQDIVQERAGDLRRVERFELGEVDGHLGWRFGAGDHLELHLDAVDLPRLPGLTKSCRSVQSA